VRFSLQGISIGIIFWIFDAAIDSYVFHAGDFFSMIFSPTGEEILNRLLIIIFLVMIGSVYTNVGTVNFKREIKRLKDAEGTLQQNHNLLRAVIEGTPDAVYVKDLQGHYLMINSASARILGKSVEEVVGGSDAGLFSSETARQFREDDSRIINSGNTETFEITVNTAGVNRTFLTTKAPYRNHQGNIVGVFGISRDITERKLDEERIRSEYAFRKAIEDSMLAGIAAADLSGRIIYVNPAFCQMVGWKEEELLGSTPPYVFWPPEEIETIRNIFQKRLSGGGPREIEYRFRRRNEERFYVLVLLSSLMDGQGKRIGLLASFYDITEKRKMEEELFKVQKLESLGLFAGGIAHDFNNILTAIMGNISLLKSWVDPQGRLFSRLAEAEKASLRAKDLARQLLTFARGGSPVKKTASIKELLEHSVQFILRGSNVRSQFFFKEGLQAVNIDEGQISQVIHNLVINAKQAMPEGGTIQIKAENLTLGENQAETRSLRKENYVKISIQDEGAGIPKEILSKIFDPYFTTKQKGSGLGLSISFSIIQRHDGFMTVDSEPGVGTTVFLYLPTSSQVIVPQIEVEEGLITGKGRVLMMDDEESVLEVAGEMLKRLGYEFVLTRGGTEAVTQYKKAMDSGQPFDAVITDLTVPGNMGGVETLQRLKELDPQVKVIVSSGYSNDPVMAKFESYGFADYIMKPYKINDLSKVCHRVIKS
jgi:PAS domain S-box-containing protein